MAFCVWRLVRNTTKYWYRKWVYLIMLIFKFGSLRSIGFFFWQNWFLLDFVEVPSFFYMLTLSPGFWMMTWCHPKKNIKKNKWNQGFPLGGETAWHLTSSVGETSWLFGIVQGGTLQIFSFFRIDHAIFLSSLVLSDSIFLKVNI